MYFLQNKKYNFYFNTTKIGVFIMVSIQLKLSRSNSNKLRDELLNAENEGDMWAVKRVLSILALGKGNTVSEVAIFLETNYESVRNWLKKYLLFGIKGLRSKKRPGRPSKLTKAQRKELARLIESGPKKAGFPGGCWRTPMIQYLIQKEFGVFYNARYISQLLRSMGFSYQKAKFISDKGETEKRKEWLEEKWPEILKVSKKKDAYILFGDECSFPQWGSLSYTWARRGQQPTIETCGKRKGYKIFGLIEYFTGRFYSQGIEGKLNGDSYIAFLKGVLKKTRKHLIIIQDGAPYHRGKIVKDFFEANASRITVYQLPSYSPDYNPIEKLWKKVKEKGTHLQYFPTFEHLKSKVNEMLVFFDNVRQEVLSLFGFYDNLEFTAEK